MSEGVKLEAAFRRADERARSRLHALKEAAKFARERQESCERQADEYRVKHPSEPYWERSERCAGLEARHIAERIEALIKECGT